MRRAMGAVVPSIGLVAVLVTVLASCGGPATKSDPSRAASNAPTYEVMAGDVKGLGAVLVDGGGYTLYLFEPDDHASKSTCADICADEWPPLLLPTAVKAARPGRGIRPGLLGATPRADGSVQVTYNGWPLYLWPDDLSPGQATGQGLNNVGGLWYVVSPEGNAVR